MNGLPGQEAMGRFRSVYDCSGSPAVATVHSRALAAGGSLARPCAHSQGTSPEEAGRLAR